MLCFIVAFLQYNNTSDIKHGNGLSCFVIISMLPSFNLSRCAEKTCEN